MTNKYFQKRKSYEDLFRKEAPKVYFPTTNV